MRTPVYAAWVLLVLTCLGCRQQAQQPASAPPRDAGPSSSVAEAGPDEVVSTLLQAIRDVDGGTTSANDAAKAIEPFFSEGFRSDMKHHENTPEGFLKCFSGCAERDVLVTGTLARVEAWSRDNKYAGVGELRTVARRHSLRDDDVYALVNGGNNLWVLRKEASGWTLLVALK